MTTIRLALAQINPTVGDLSGNLEKIMSFVSIAKRSEADVVAFPELSVTGYPPEDLLLKPQFVKENIEATAEIAEKSGNIATVFGFVDFHGERFNSAAVAYQGKIVGTHRKIFLPNYGVFDEARYFKAGQTCPVFTIAGVSIGLNICEDIWYESGPTGIQRAAGAEIIININGSPFHAGKRDERENMLRARAKDHGLFIAYVNQVGGQDELVFDGSSVILDPQGKIICRAPQFEEDMVICDINVEALRELRRDGSSNFQLEGQDDVGSAQHFFVSGKSMRSMKKIPSEISLPVSAIEEIRKALIMGTHDYVSKSGFKKVLIALSGGIDSSLVAALAVEALGPENVIGVSMPSQYSSEGSQTDAQQLADNLGIAMETLPISDVYESMNNTLEKQFSGTDAGIAEENLQSRIRGNLIMALSNKFGWLVLATGNKSEMAVGYATIYGDMAGGFSVIKDVPKIMVYDICHHINAKSGRDIIPQTVLEKPPSAELRPDQKDSDSLPAYELLDPILEAYVEKDSSFEDIIDMGFMPDVVKKVITLVDRNEYKRRQAPPGVKITPRNF
ncbi:uncharacterized protein METZ01_LOCUS168068, partial [marine metagenome]